jgi:multidrug efflux system membrane fusion protein
VSRALACGAVIVFALACGCTPKKDTRKPRVPVTVAAARTRTVPFVLVSTGNVEATRTAQVGVQVTGVVKRVSFHEGDEVTEGQELIRIDSRGYRAALDQARSTLQRDRAQADIATSNMERARKTYEQQVISQAEWDQARSTADQWQGTVLADSAAVQTARLNLEYCEVRAPIGGRTGRLLVHEGDLVKASSSEALVTINQTHPVRVAFTVPESSVPMVQRYRSKQPKVYVRLAAGDSERVEGTLAFVDNAVDPASGTLLLKGEFPNRDNRLIPGQFVDVRLVLYEQPNAIVVPEPAVTRGQQGSFVYVMQPDSTVSPRQVTIERSIDETVVISKGLQPGEIVVTDGQLRLSPGARVMVRNEPGSAP